VSARYLAAPSGRLWGSGLQQQGELEQLAQLFGEGWQVVEAERLEPCGAGCPFLACAGCAWQGGVNGD